VISGVLLLGSTPQGRRVGATLYRGLVAGCVAGIAVLLLYPDALWARWSFYYETVTPWSAESELAYRLWEYPIGNLLAVLGSSHWMLGQGTGTASLGGQYVTGLLGLPAPEAGVESGYGAIILELGVLGLVLWLAWTAVIVREAWRATWAIRNSALFSLALAIFWFVALLLFPMTFGGIQPYQNFVFNAYLWLMLGVLFRLPDLANGITPPVLQR
jgi:O-antigen ligase